MNRVLLPRPTSSIEPLETRIAPAAIFTFTDADGHAVKITSSKGTLADLQAALAPLPNGEAPTQILTLTLGAVFRGADITIVAGESDADDTVTKIGFLNATGIDLGRVAIDGELNKIVAGDANSRSAGVRGLTVNTFGKFDVTPATTTAGEFDSTITGALLSLRVKGDMQGAFLRVIGSATDTAAASFRNDLDGRIGSIDIGGSLVGTARPDGGGIEASGDIGRLTVLHDIRGLTGANAPVAGQDRNARISSGRTLGAITIGGDIIGGDGVDSGHITSGGGMGALTVTNVIGGFGEESGVVGSSGTLGKITVLQSVTGGGGLRSGSILSSFNMQAVTVGVDLVGGVGEASGWIASSGALASVTVMRDVIGGDGQFSGTIGARLPLGSVKIGRDLVGGDGPSSGQVVSGSTIRSVTVGRDLVGGSDFETGAIGSLRGLGPILIEGSIVAGTGVRSALITTQKASYGEGEPFITAPIASVTVNGSIMGVDPEIIDPEDLDGFDDGQLQIRALAGPAGNGSAGIQASGSLGPVLIRGDVFGGDGDSSGRISANLGITSVTITGSLAGGGGNASGSISASGVLGPVFIGGDLAGGEGNFSGNVFSATRIARVTIGGNLFGGNGFFSGSIQTSNESAFAADIGAIFIGGSVVGGDRLEFSGSIYSDGGIASVTIGDPKVDDENETGSLIGRVADGSGSITSFGELGPVKIKSFIQGGAGNNSGRIFSGDRIVSLDVGASVEGGTGAQISFSGPQEQSEPGQVFARESIGRVKIGGSLDGGAGNFTAQIRGFSIGSVVVGDFIGGRGGEGSGSIIAFGAGIGSVEITHSLFSGAGQRSGWIAAQHTIGSVEVDFISGSGPTRPRISAGDAIGTVTVTGGTFSAEILAGYGIQGNPISGDAKIGTVRIGTPGNVSASLGNMTATDIVAGFRTGFSANDDGAFGTSDDVLIAGSQDKPLVHSRIASVIVAGKVQPGSATGSSHFAIKAEILGSIRVGGALLPLKGGPNNDFQVTFASAPNTSYGELADEED